MTLLLRHAASTTLRLRMRLSQAQRHTYTMLSAHATCRCHTPTPRHTHFSQAPFRYFVAWNVLTPLSYHCVLSSICCFQLR